MSLEAYEHEAAHLINNPLVVKGVVLVGGVILAIGATRWALRKVMGN
jgi:hypothetical protein